LNGKFLPSFWEKLKSYYYTQNEDLIKEKLGIDFKRVTMDPPSSFKERAVIPPFVDIGTGTETYLIHHPDGSYEDEWGVKRRASRSEDCWYYDFHPLQDWSFDEYGLPDLNLAGRLDNAIDQIHKFKSSYVISAVLPNLFKHAWVLRGWDNFLQDLCLNVEYVETLLDILGEYKLMQVEKFIKVGVDLIELGGDIGMQNRMIISPEMWRRYFKPRLRTLIQKVKRKFPHIWFFFHSDGYIKPVIPDLIEIGFDILNPIQPESMDPAELKELFGDRITFDGTISLQKTLPFGTVEDVKDEVIQRITTCGMNGGFILAPSNDVTADVPVENIIALYDTAKNYRL
jgi:uroporphyrinogen decarboxylase